MEIPVKIGRKYDSPFCLCIRLQIYSKGFLRCPEIEFEAGGAGTAVETKIRRNGEYETEIEKGGEVALEQFHITRLILPELNVRVGHIIVPVGLTNFNHEPINFFGTSRPEGETTIIPSTWHETGLEIFGTLGLVMPVFPMRQWLWRIESQRV